MAESNKPLLEAESKSTASASWQELLKLKSDPNRKIYIDKIEISLHTYRPTTEVAIRVEINGAPLMREFYPVVATTTLSFGRDLVFEGKTDKPPVLIKVESDGTTTVHATCIVTGIQTEYHKPPETE